MLYCGGVNFPFAVSTAAIWLRLHTLTPVPCMHSSTHTYTYYVHTYTTEEYMCLPPLLASSLDHTKRSDSFSLLSGLSASLFIRFCGGSVTALPAQERLPYFPYSSGQFYLILYIKAERKKAWDALTHTHIHTQSDIFLATGDGKASDQDSPCIKIPAFHYY